MISAVNIFFSFRAGFIFADEQNLPLASETKLSESQKQAIIYRLEGLRLQKSGNIEVALSLFQKAVETDPSLAAAYNDIGIMYETMDSPELAESAYLTAIKLDQEFAGPYANLALFYESQNQMDKAVFYWAKRAEMGLEENFLSPPLPGGVGEVINDDPWRKKAQDRYNELMASMPELKEKQLESEEAELRNKIIRERKQQRPQE